MKIARLVVVQSSQFGPPVVSLRGPKGRGAHDPAHPHLTVAGFQPGDRVVVIAEHEYEALLDSASRGDA